MKENSISNYENKGYKKYHLNKEYDKALHILHGLLRGVAIDNEINESEIQEILNWCRLHQNLKNKQPFKDIIFAIEENLNHDELTTEEIKDILWLFNNFESKNESFSLITSDIQRLHGILHGIMADNQITDKEIYGLKSWLDENTHLTKIYPYDEICSIISSVTVDKVITKDERNLLKIIFTEFIDTKNSYNINTAEINELKNKITLPGICSLCPEICFENNTFCFTGISNKTSRSRISEIVTQVGGTFKNIVTLTTNYLIVGDNGNPCWTYACYGRKVETAIEMRKKGQNILIVHENDFWDEVQNLGIAV